MGHFYTVLSYLHSFSGPSIMLYPLYASIEAIESPSKVDDEQWLAYWILYSFLTLMEMAAQPILKWIPIWYEIRVMLFAWLVLPQFRGAAFIYDKFVRQQLRKLGGGNNSTSSTSSTNSSPSKIKNKFTSLVSPKKVVEKLSAIAPAVETKLKVLTSIAEEHHVKWDSEAFREQHQKPHDDLLNGSNMFVSASKMLGESYIVNSASAPSQMDKPKVPLPRNDTTRRSTSFSPSFQTNNRTTDDTVPRSSNIRSEGVTMRSSKGYEENIQTGSYSADKLQRRSSSTSLHNSQPSPRSHKASSNSNDSNKKLEMPSMPLGAEDLEISNGFDNTRSRQGLNFGSLVGEFRHAGFPRPPYAKSSSSDASCLSKQTSSSTSTRTYNDPDSKERNPTADTRAYRESNVTRIDKVTPSYSNKTGAGLESRTINTYGHESQMKARKESSLRINNLDSDDNEVKLDSNYTAGNRGNEFSPRARDVPLQSRISNTKPHGLYNMTNTSRMEYKPSQASFPAPEPISGETRDAVNLQQGTYKHSHPFPSDEQPAVAPKRTLPDSGVQKSKEESKLPSPSGDSTSREGSFERASHVHPKLPDCDTFPAHFRALWSNQQ